MLKKDSFQWSPEATCAFNQLKAVVAQPPILVLLDFAKDFVVECDATESGIGAMLS